MRNVFLLVKNTLKLFFRRKGNLIYILLSVLIPFVVLTLNLSGSSKLTIGVINNDTGILSKDLVNSFKDSQKFKVVNIDKSNLDKYVTKGNIDFAIIFPKDFSKNVIEDKPLKVQIVSIKGKEVALAVKNYIDEYISNLKYLSISSNGDSSTFYKMYQEYEKNALIKLGEYTVKDKSVINDIMTRSVGMFIMFLMMGTSRIAELMLQEKRDKTYSRICAAPVKSIVYASSNFIVNMIVTLFQIGLIMLLLAVFLKLPFDKSFLEIFVILVAFGISAIGLSMLIVAFSDSTAQSGGLSTLIITPSCMLGGAFWPIEVMPKIFQKVSYFMPQRWAIDAITKIEGATSSSDVLLNIFILLAFALTFILIASYKMKMSNKMADFV